MNTLQEIQRVDVGALKKFAQAARRKLREQVAAQLDRIMKNDSAELREKGAAIKELKNQIATSSREAVIDRVAYVWFNRFCALRFMDVNQYTRIGTVSPADGFTQPEILAEAKQGHIDESIKPFIDAKRVHDLLDGHISSKDPQQEAFRLLIVAVCNYYHSTMPFLFEKISDYTELLMPDDLLSNSSVLSATRETLTKEACRDVECIGWLYQYYISEKKDEVFEDLKRNKKIPKENIPAATQLFTPHWIVRYLVENSLGRLWMLNKPNSRLIEHMKYYIKPDQPETDFLRVTKPDEIRVCDPACGSGHMLVYAFDLLYKIYEEEGYEAIEIPKLILLKNLYGIEIDERAAELAAFALTMKAREKDRRFFARPVQPNICVLQDIHIDQNNLDNYVKAVGSNLFTKDLYATITQFEDATNFGSLIRPVLCDTAETRRCLDEKKIAENVFHHNIHETVLRVLDFTEYLSSKYHVVVANPPYMGSKGMNNELRAFAEKNYTDSRFDLFAMFIERGFELLSGAGYNAMVTMESWMFLSSYEEFRKRLFNKATILSMVHMPYLGKGGTSMGINFGTSATIFRNTHMEKARGNFSCVRYYECDDYGVPTSFPVQNERLSTASVADFRKITGFPIAYWVTDAVRKVFSAGKPIGEVAAPRKGNTTTDNNRFLRFWPEVSRSSCAIGYSSGKNVSSDDKKWVPYNKGGGFRKWYGFNEFLVNWHRDGAEIKAIPHSVIANEKFFFQPGLTWSTVTSTGNFSIRNFGPGYIFDNGGCCVFGDQAVLAGLLLFMNSNVFVKLYSEINPTLNFQSGDVAKVPYIEGRAVTCPDDLIPVRICKEDWDSFETSWDFQSSPLLRMKQNIGQENTLTLQDAYNALRSSWNDLTARLVEAQQENNHAFIQAYGLESELTPDVSLSDATITCNPRFRYGQKPDHELESLLLVDTMKEFISYSVGCMFGRYSLDRPGLILANQGDTKDDYLGLVPNPTFAIDEDNVLPILDGDWFTDDISERFRKFLRVSFGDKHYQTNVQFIENALGKDLRKYFLRDFYGDHVKRYKKRPIYWLFSSPKGTFNALIYMHRYRPDTVSVVLNDYLREFRNKLSARKNHLEAVTVSGNVGAAEKTKALKEIESLKKNMDELDTYERSVLYPLATQKIQIDLDDGVKVNYLKFGKALKAIPGMASEEG